MFIRPTSTSTVSGNYSTEARFALHLWQSNADAVGMSKLQSTGFYVGIDGGQFR